MTKNATLRFVFEPDGYPDVNLDAATYEAAMIVIAVPSLAIDTLLANYPDRLKKVPTISSNDIPKEEPKKKPLNPYELLKMQIKQRREYLKMHEEKDEDEEEENED